MSAIEAFGWLLLDWVVGIATLIVILHRKLCAAHRRRSSRTRGRDIHELTPRGDVGKAPAEARA